MEAVGGSRTVGVSGKLQEDEGFYKF